MHRTRAFFCQRTRNKLWTVIILLLTIGSSRAFGMNSGRTDTSMTLPQFLDLLFDGDTTDVFMKISIKEFSAEEWASAQARFRYGQKKVSKGLNVKLIFPESCLSIEKRGIQILCDSVHFDKPVIIDHNEFVTISFLDCTFNDQIILYQKWQSWRGCKFMGGVTLHNDDQSYPHKTFKGYGGEGASSIKIVSCTFWESDLSLNGFKSIEIRRSSFHIKDSKGNDPWEWYRDNIMGVKIWSRDEEITDLVITDSHIEVDINGNVKVTRHFNIDRSRLKFINFNGIELPEDIYEFKCKWDQLDTAFGISDNGNVDITENPEDWTVLRIHEKSSALEERQYDLLRTKAYMVANIYRAQGDLESYNGVYKRIKKLENERYRIDYKQNPTFEGLFKWRLNELLFYYSDYGTNPAKAVVKSLWVIFIFAFFYLLFPSEWDISSKSMILANLKNAKGSNGFNWKAALKALMAFLVSCANALTLSLNSFITLGFGHIPTKGMARYFTIIQGFIGWFLLTIFSVSLIGQVLN